MPQNFKATLSIFGGCAHSHLHSKNIHNDPNDHFDTIGAAASTALEGMVLLDEETLMKGCDSACLSPKITNLMTLPPFLLQCGKMS